MLEYSLILRNLRFAGQSDECSGNKEKQMKNDQNGGKLKFRDQVTNNP